MNLARNTHQHRAEGNRKLAASTREYRTIMSEIARLFQRAALIADEAQRQEMMGILSDTKQRLVDLAEKIDSDRKARTDSHSDSNGPLLE